MQNISHFALNSVIKLKTFSLFCLSILSNFDGTSDVLIWNVQNLDVYLKCTYIKVSAIGNVQKTIRP
jgi:hypothetical protein